jgi:hypothetical protein
MRALYYDFQIDGRPVLVPDADLSVSAFDMAAEDSGRDESGVLHRFLLRQGVRSFVLRYDTLTQQEYRYLCSLIEGKDTIRVTYRNADDQSAELIGYCAGYSLLVHNARQGIYKGMKLEIQEC